MIDMVITPEHRAARNAASIALADAGGPGAASLRLTDAAGTLLAQITLARPCASLTPEGRIALHVGGAPEIAIASGIAAQLHWCDGAGQAIASASVSAPGGGGAIELAGSAGAQIYAGAALQLAGLLLG